MSEEENLSLGYHLAANSNPMVDGSALLSYLDPNTKKAELMIKLMGLEYDEVEQEYKKVREALVRTEAGINWVSYLIDPFFSVSSTTNTLKDRDIYHITYNLIEDISTAFKTSTLRKQYGLDIDQLDKVGGFIVNHCYLNIKRSENGGDRKLLDQNVKRVESYNISKDEKAKKGFGGLDFFSR